MWPFKRKPTTAWEEQYANNIYEGLVAHNDFGDITALKLRIPFGLHQAYHNKILLQREFICFQAFAAIADQGRLPPVRGRPQNRVCQSFFSADKFCYC